MGIDGVGRMTALSISNAWPEKDTASPRNKPWMIAKDSLARMPRRRGLTPQTSSSCGSSPPMPTPNVNRPGATLAIDANCLATGSGCRKGSK